MEAERQQSIVSSLPILAMLAIIAGAYYVSRLPLESSRPESPLGLGHVVPEEDKIDARLWQDPLKVALDHEKAMHREGQPEDRDPRWDCISRHCVNQLTERIDNIVKENVAKPDASVVHVLLIIVRDGNFAEDHERRLRNRYAVLTALSASGLAPVDSKRIQYFKLLWTEEEELEKGIKEDNIPKIVPVVEGESESRTIFVPYEWFKCMNLSPDNLKQRCPNYAVVVWLPESAFSHRPLTRLAQVFDALSNTYDCQVETDVIGPSYSDTLLAMLKETVKLCGKDGQSTDNGFDYVKLRLYGLTIFSPWATASPALLIREADPNTDKSYDSLSEMFSEISDKFQPLGIKFLRMIGSDDLLALELVRELYRRGVDVRLKVKDQPKDDNPNKVEDPNKLDNVALISEWDTFYGKAFPLIFAMMIENIDPETLELNWNKYTSSLAPKIPSLRTYSYIRGVDGKLLQSQASEERQPDEKTESESKWTYTKSLELPIGRSQLDYVRRLAQDIKDDSEVGELKAIGVIGSDVYDKLILLHALREEFSDAILFMTDLDARMMHHEQFRWTRNVIVSSNFGLQLNKKYHSVPENVRRNLPPFRDNYQTSLFFACQTALGLPISGAEGRFRDLSQQQLTKYISHPRLFEVGRGRAIDLSVDKVDKVDKVDIHPLTRLFPRWGTFFKLLGLILAALVFFVLLLAQINTNVKKVTSSLKKKLVETICNTQHTKGDKTKKEKKKWNAWEIITTVSIPAAVIFVAVVLFDHYRPRGEPFSLVAGISIWPGEALRLIATILSVCFLAKSMSDLRLTSKQLRKDFCFEKLEKSRHVTFRKWRMNKMASDKSNSQTTLYSPCRELDTIFNWIRYWLQYCNRIGFHTSKVKKKRANAQRLWTAYLIRGAYCNRFHRLTLMSLAYIGLAFALMWILGQPKAPYRGNVSFIVNWILLFSSGVSMIILIFFVVDATKLSINFVRNLKNPITIWPEKLINSFSFKEKNTKKSSTKTGRGAKFSEDSLGHIHKKALAEWLDIKFIASHTEAVGKLIYYPFFILLIMFVARSRYFDNWDLPILLIIIYLLNATFALCCGCMLRREAEKTRNIAMSRLGEYLVTAKAACDDCCSKQIETMMEQVKSIRQGAYSPFTENPVLHAILIPSGGLSLLTLLRFISLS